MKSRFLYISPLIAGIGLAALITGCNKQPNPAANGAAAEAPPIAALPLAAAAVAPAAPAPEATALPAPSRPIAYAPPPPQERYRYIDRAYAMGDAFADTPPDYTVDYQGTRPWIWRAGNGAYRIVERLPRGQRIYYYGPGQDQPFMVRDPDYAYAYDNGELVGVYGPDGRELDPEMAARRADYAARYYDRSRDLYRAAQYQRRQAAYAAEWAARRDELRREHMLWEEDQARNPDWRSWHEAHQAQVQSEWNPERDQRLAYAQAIGIPVASSGPLPNPDELARRQAAFFASRNASRGQAPAANTAPSPPLPTNVAQNPVKPVPPVVKGPPVPTNVAQSPVKTAPPVVKGPPVPAPQTANVQQAQAAAAQAKAAAQAQQAAAEAQKKEAAAAQAKAAAAAQAQKAAAESKQKETAAAQAKAAQAAQAQKAATEAKQKEAAAAQAKAAEAAQAQKAAAEAHQKEAAAAQAKAAQAAQAQKAAADARQKEAAAAQAKAAQAAEAQKAAAEARQKEAAAAQAKAAEAAQAQKAAAEAKQHEAAAAQAAQGKKPASEEHPGKPANPKAKGQEKKTAKTDQQ